MNILFFDHHFHKKTKSSDFFINILRSYANVEVEYISPSDFSDIKFKPKQDIDYYVFWQVLPIVDQIRELPNERVIFIPMYDGCCTFTYRRWNQYRQYKFISFSKKIHGILESLNISSLYIQYMTPDDYSSVDIPKEDKISMFIWKRTPNLNLEKLIPILIKNGIERIVCHGFEKKYQIQYNGIEVHYITEWFKSHEDYINAVRRCHYFLAPRLYEGIGMGFLEAMSYGLCVIAPNQSTMNEYVVHGKTGYIFNTFKDIKIDLSKLSEISKETREYCDNIRVKWNLTAYRIKEFMHKENISMPYVSPLLYVHKDIGMFFKIRVQPFIRRKLQLQDY